MAEIWRCRRMDSALEILARAEDGDTIELAWPTANQYQKQIVESRAVSLGLNLIVTLTQKGLTP